MLKGNKSQNGIWIAPSGVIAYNETDFLEAFIVRVMCFWFDFLI
jgi:hypothetical protein